MGLGLAVKCSVSLASRYFKQIKMASSVCILYLSSFWCLEFKQAQREEREKRKKRRRTTSSSYIALKQFADMTISLETNPYSTLTLPTGLVPRVDMRLPSPVTRRRGEVKCDIVYYR